MRLEPLAPRRARIQTTSVIAPSLVLLFLSSVGQAEVAPLRQPGAPLNISISSGHALLEEEEEQVTQSAPEKRVLDRLQVHGFLTQAYAESELARGGLQSPTNDEITLGIPESGTTDYRTLALQFNYELSARDKAVIQLSHRRLGTSPVTRVEDELKVDWAFFEHRFGERSYVKVGRILIPLGIFNEIRDVGTLLPFFRPPFTFYGDGSFTAETVDGVMWGRNFGAPSNWSFDLDIYYGGFELIEFPPTGLPTSVTEAVIARAEDAIGAHLWIDTPIRGLRIGGGARSFHPTGGLFELPGTRTDWWGWSTSLEAAFEHIVFRTEYGNFRPEANTLPGTGVPISIMDDARSFYAQIGFHPTQRWRFYVQYETQEAARREIEGFSEPLSFTTHTGRGVAINYVYDHAVIKLEHHLIDFGTFAIGDLVPQPFGPPLLEPVTKTAKDGRQTILSLSVSF